MFRWLLPAFCITSLQPAFAAGPELYHVVTGRWAAGTEGADTQLLELAWEPEAEWRGDDGGRVTAIGRLRWQPESGLRPTDMERGSYSPVSRPAVIAGHTEVSLRELYYERPLGSWYLTLGKQQVVWGKADGLKVLDVVNPQSFREFILEDFEQSRIPLWTVNAERPLQGWMGGAWTLQLLWVPDQTYHAVPERDATYAFRSRRLVPAPPPSGIFAQLTDPVRPSRFLRDSDAGARLTGFLKGWDLSLNYLYQYRNQPAFHLEHAAAPSPALRVTPRYHRTHLIGGAFSRALGDWVVRGEAAYFTDRFLLTDDPASPDGVARSPELSYVLGLDWSGLEDTFVSAQLFQSWLPEHRRGFTRPELDTSVTVLARRDFWNETLTAEALLLANANDGDGLLRPKVSYDMQDNLEVWVGLDLFYGNRNGLYGQFDDNDRLLVGVRVGL